MNRRGFLKFLGGGLVASATMAEAGALAEFMDWLKRSPVWSFPSKIGRDPLFDEINAVTLNEIREQLILNEFFVDTPFQSYLRASGARPWENVMLQNVQLDYP